MMHRKYSNIEFKIMKVGTNTVVIRVRQDKHLSENYADQETLATRTKELFSKFVDKKIQAKPIPFKEHGISAIDNSWVKSKVDSLNLRVTDIVNDTGISKANVSAWVNGLRPMSQPVKAMFHFYFLAKEGDSRKMFEAFNNLLKLIKKGVDPADLKVYINDLIYISTNKNNTQIKSPLPH